MILFSKNVESHKIRIVDNSDKNIHLNEWLGIYVDNVLNLLAPIDLDTVIFALNNIKEFDILCDYIEEYTWISHLKR